MPPEPRRSSGKDGPSLEGRGLPTWPRGRQPPAVTRGGLADRLRWSIRAGAQRGSRVWSGRMAGRSHGACQRPLCGRARAASCGSSDRRAPASGPGQREGLGQAEVDPLTHQREGTENPSRSLSCPADGRRRRSRPATWRRRTSRSGTRGMSRVDGCAAHRGRRVPAPRLPASVVLACLRSSWTRTGRQWATLRDAGEGIDASQSTPVRACRKGRMQDRARGRSRGWEVIEVPCRCHVDGRDAASGMVTARPADPAPAG